MIDPREAFALYCSDLALSKQNQPLIRYAMPVYMKGLVRGSVIINLRLCR